MSLRADKELEVPHQPTLWGHHLPPCLPSGRAPGLDARGRGVWDVLEAVTWDPFHGFEVRPSRRRAR